MFSVYCIEAEDGSYYTGVTANRSQRLWQHNHGKCDTTRGGRWHFHYWIDVADQCDALLCERWLKSGDTKKKRAQMKLAFDMMTPDMCAEALLTAARRWREAKVISNMKGGA